MQTAARTGRRKGATISVATLVVACLLLAAAVLTACRSNQSEPLALVTPGPPLPARPGANVWVVGLPDLVLASADGGSSWKVAHQGKITDASLGDLWSVVFGDADHGWAVERGGESSPTKILATGDGGATWSWQYPGPRGKLLAVAASDASHAWAVGYSGTSAPVSGRSTGLMLATSDGGAIWKQQPIPPHIDLYDVAFGDARHGWALGAGADQSTYFVLSMIDGGAHWRVSYKTKVGHLSRLACSGTRRCWVVGSTPLLAGKQSGYLAATSDGGRHWRSDRSVSTSPLCDVSFPDVLHGWAVGPLGAILATHDGGTTWAAQHTDGRFNLQAVAFSDAAHGWALISHMALLATGNGGRTWSVVRPTGTRGGYLAALACFGSGTGK